MFIIDYFNNYFKVFLFLIKNINNFKKLDKMKDMNKVQIKLVKHGKLVNIVGIQIFKCSVLMK